MSVYRIYPDQDAFIIRGCSATTGKDEILEIGYRVSHTGNEGIARTLLTFPQDKIEEVRAKVAGKEVKVYLTLVSAKRMNVPNRYTIQVYRVSEDWTEGVGRITDKVVDENGVSWIKRSISESWIRPGGTIEGTPVEFECTGQVADLRIDLTDMFLEGTVQNILMKLADEDQAYRDRINLMFYGADTHTIFRPFLDINVDDSSIEPEKIVIPSTNYKITSKTLGKEILKEDKVRVEIGTHPVFPERRFSTGSIYRDDYILPEESYWGIQDIVTKFMVVDFGVGTKLSADSTGNFFILDASTLSSGRYYDIFVRVNNGEATKTHKVIQGLKVEKICQQ